MANIPHISLSKLRGNVAWRPGEGEESLALFFCPFCVVKAICGQELGPKQSLLVLKCSNMAFSSGKSVDFLPSGLLTCPEAL